MPVCSGTLSRFAATLLAAAIPGAALAQAVPPQSVPPAAAAPASDPVVAKVDGVPIHLSEVKAAAEALPANLRAVPFETIYPKLLDSMISQRVLAAAARKAGIDKTPEVQQQIAAATDQVLDNALLTKVVMPSVNDQALHARYEKEIAGKPGDEEVHAKHILVESEDQAKQIIAQLEKGADFAALAKQYSKDPGAADGGDLGFFKKGDMVPAFADAAFALQPGQFTKTPVHTQFGWHVIEVVERRQAPPPSFEQAADGLRQQMLKEGVQQEIAKARAAADVQTFNMDGSPMRATDSAVPPPPAPAK
ncbi:MAG TPA: peptidylprolyl isomerase [Acetobacteraceae bacterium]